MLVYIVEMFGDNGVDSEDFSILQLLDKIGNQFASVAKDVALAKFRLLKRLAIASKFGLYS